MKYNQDVYQVVINHNDEGKEVYFSELGWTDFGTRDEDALNRIADNYVQSYKHIKEDWRTIIYGNPKPILENLKNNIEELTYNKIEDLYYFFRDKYQYYL